MALAIILFTIVARLVILPLTIKSLEINAKDPRASAADQGASSANMARILRSRKRSTTKLYREYRVNPVGGCLPMLLQLPIFFGVYQAVIHLTQVSVSEYVAGTFLLRCLATAVLTPPCCRRTSGSRSSPASFCGSRISVEPDPLHILGVLSLVFQLIVQLMAMPRVQDAQQKAMSQSMLILPLMFAYIGFTFSAGAVLYWVVGSLLSMIQQYVISGRGSLANYLKFLPPDRGLFPPAAPVAAAAIGAGELEVAPKLGFWDVLRPLTEQGSASTTELGEGELPAEHRDEAPAPALQAVRRPTGQPVNPRRQKARR